MVCAAVLHVLQVGAPLPPIRLRYDTAENLLLRKVLDPSNPQHAAILRSCGDTREWLAANQLAAAGKGSTVTSSTGAAARGMASTTHMCTGVTNTATWTVLRP